MQVLLTENVADLGRRGVVVTVKPGYARNFLLPRKLAVAVTKTNLKQIELEKKRMDKIERQRMENLKSVADQITKLSLTIPVAVNEEGHLFGSVGTREILVAMAQENFNLEEKAIHLEEPIKEVGVYEIQVALADDVAATLHLWVVKE